MSNSSGRSNAGCEAAPVRPSPHLLRGCEQGSAHHLHPASAAGDSPDTATKATKKKIINKFTSATQTGLVKSLNSMARGSPGHPVTGRKERDHNSSNPAAGLGSACGLAGAPGAVAMQNDSHVCEKNHQLPTDAAGTKQGPEHGQ